MDSLRVMSFNIAGGYDEHEPENAWIGSGRSGLVCRLKWKSPISSGATGVRSTPATTIRSFRT